MTLFANEPLRIYLERADGMLYTGDVMVANLTITHGYDEWPAISVPSEWEITLVGTGELVLSETNLTQLRSEIEQPEWRCSFCGAVMPKAERKCEGCGAWRSFVYDL